ncbi:hypothetical protein HDU76_012007, partial [Blyttiomyces sp. JEL0837]
MAGIGVNIVNFKIHDIGKVTGVLLLFYGLSGTIYSQIYFNSYRNNASGYLIFLAISVFVINFLCCFTIFAVPPTPAAQSEPTTTKGSTSDGDEFHQARGLPKKLESTRSMSSIPEMMMAAAEVKRTTSQVSLTHESLRRRLSRSLLGSQMTIRLSEEMILHDGAPEKDKANLQKARESGLPPVKPPPGIAGANAEPVNSNANQTPATFQVEDPKQPIEASLSPLQILQSPIFWMYTTTFVFQQGLTYITNVSAIVAAASSNPAVPTSVMSGDALDAQTAIHVTLISVFQSLGRLVFGVVSDLLVKPIPIDDTSGD